VQVERSFGFVDLCAFTEFSERFGDEQAVLVLADLRAAVRQIAARRGVRVAKWLGDGAMCTCTETGPLVGLALELGAHLNASGSRLMLRTGLDLGPAIMFEGDDYIGRAVNVASRLCDIARPGQVLATYDVSRRVPAWCDTRSLGPRPMKGFKHPVEVFRLDIEEGPDMIVDPVCHLCLPLNAGLLGAEDDEGQKLYFCSVACSEAWQQERRSPALPPRLR
jgi:adenylate cyclase